MSKYLHFYQSNNDSVLKVHGLYDDLISARDAVRSHGGVIVKVLEMVIKDEEISDESIES